MDGGVCSPADILLFSFIFYDLLLKALLSALSLVFASCTISLSAHLSHLHPDLHLCVLLEQLIKQRSVFVLVQFCLFLSEQDMLKIHNKDTIKFKEVEMSRTWEEQETQYNGNVCPKRDLN